MTIASSIRPLVSIVTPARNAAPTLDRAFTSIADQGLDNWEHVVVTHPADPDTSRVARGHANRDDRIVHKVVVSGTAAGARNAGLAHARGHFIMFLDADDTVAPDHLARLVREARRTGADVVLSGFRRVTHEGRPFQTRAGLRGFVPADVIAQGPPAALHAMLFRRELLDRIGFFDATLKTNEDWDLCLRAAAAGARFYACGSCSADYWNHEGSLTGDGSTMVRDRVEVARRALRLGVRGDQGESMEQQRIDLERDGLRTGLWAGAMAVAREQDTGAILAEMRGLKPLAPLSLEAEEGGAALLDGLAVGFGCRYEAIEQHLAGRWPQLEAFLAQVADLCADPGFDNALLAVLERDLARIGPAGSRRRVGRSLVVPASSALLRPIEAEPDARQVIVRFPVVRPRSRATLAVAPSAANGRSALSLAMNRTFAWLAERPQSAEGPAARARDLLVRALVVGKRVLRPHGPPAPANEDVDPQSGTEWEEIFSSENPWHYHREYEQAKYERTMALLPDRPIGRALELACAEGHFTERLARRVGHLTASDISSTALARCRQRCEEQGLDNLDYLELDFFNQPFGTGWDLIVSSEVLYYMGSPEKLSRYAERVVEALADGGLFLHAHAYQVSDTPEHSGFDWGDEFAAGTISRAFGANPDLRLESAVEAELYRIELYRKLSPAERQSPPAPAVPVEISMKAELDTALAADVVWNGALVTRLAAEAERHFRVPVLMYHSIAEDGPAGLASWRTSPEAFEHQLRFLRRRGYRSVSMEEWDTARSRGAALSGRPVVITFDDGFQDFADIAWPILQRNGFGAHMFVVSDAVGGVSDWDAWYGQPAPLMDWDCLSELVEQGLEIGSHCHRHRPLDRLTPAEILADATLSRQTFEERLGFAPTTVAPPYGICGPEQAELLQKAGFDRVFMAGGSFAPVWGPRLRTPRIEVAGGIGIDAFAALVGAKEPPEPADLP